jgi:hypothetical protein
MNTLLVDNYILEEEWLNLPLKILAKNPYRPFMPLNDIKNIFDRTKNSFLENGNAARWILYDDYNLCCGRIAAYYHTQTHSGRIGFFECINSYPQAKELFDVAKNWMSSQGCNQITAPVNFGEKDRYWGLLTEGFDTKGLYMDNFNPPFYQTFFETFGFCAHEKIITYKLPLNDIPAERLKLIAEYTAEKYGYSYQFFSWKEKEKFVRDIHSIYTASFQASKRLAYITETDIRYLLEHIRPLLSEQHFLIAYCGMKPVGFLAFLNEPVIQASSYHPLIKSIKGFAIATVPAVHAKGVEAGLCNEFYKVLKSSGNEYEIFLSGINAVTTRMHSFIKKLGGEQYKVHQTFIYKIG